ncbi:MAG: twin-arginine translocation signal domain-containing protein, partial [Flavobacteriales bacterium]
MSLLIAMNEDKKEMEKYWSSIQELKGQPDECKPEASPAESPVESLFNEDVINAGTSRRDFLKACGFSISAATLAAGCEGPVRKAIPFLAKPEEVTPGVANHYASTYIDGSDYCSVLVKTRDGRPIKIEGNERSSVSRGGTTARVQASVLSLYDSERLTNPLSKGEKESWKDIHSEIKANIEHIVSKEGRLILLTAPLVSPSERQAVKEFVEKYPGTELLVYEPNSFSGTLDANANCFGKRVVPSYNMEDAQLIVSFGADFLGTWLSPVEFTKQYAAARKLTKGKKTMLRHIQYEAGMTLTGANADERYTIRPSEEMNVLSALYNELAAKSGASTIPAAEVSHLDIPALSSELWACKGKSIVLSGSNDIRIQTVVNGINHLLGNYGNTIDFQRAYNLKQSDDAKMVALVDDLNEKK